MKYCGMSRPINTVRTNNVDNIFNPKNEPYQSLGDQILNAVQYGSDVGTPAVVQYDDPDTDAVDVLTDPNHDFFDIAEQYGEQVATPAPPAPADTDKTE